MPSNQQALESTPKNALLEYKLAIAMDSAGDTMGEKTTLERAVQLDERSSAQLSAVPRSVRRHARAGGYVGLGIALPDAKEAIDKALQLDPQKADALQPDQMIEAAQASH